jgi:hypothetical protein
VVGRQFYGPRGAFGRPAQQIPSTQARDHAAAWAHWDASAELTGLNATFGR